MVRIFALLAIGRRQQSAWIDCGKLKTKELSGYELSPRVGVIQMILYMI